MPSTVAGGGLLISETAALKLRYAADEMPNNEISGFGRTIERGDGIIELIDIVIPPQEVGGAHVDISPEVRDAFWDIVIKNGCTGEQCDRTHSPELEGEENTASLECDVALCRGHTARRRQSAHDVRCNTGSIKDWRVWWHKHPGTGKPTPSSTDDETLQEFASAEGFGFGWMIGIIISQDGSAIYGWLNTSTPWPLVSKDIAIEFARRDSAVLRKSVRDQVKEVTVKYTAFNTTTTRSYRPPAGGPEGKTTNGHRGSEWADKALASQIRSISRSTDPSLLGAYEIVMESGTTFITSDEDKVMAWLKTMDSQQASRRAPKAIKKAMQRAVQRARNAINKEFPKQPRKAGEKRPFVNGSERPTLESLYIGFDSNGNLIKPGQEGFLWYTLDFKPVNLAPDSDGPQHDDDGRLIISDIDTAIIEGGKKTGLQHIGFDADSTPLFKGEETHLFYGVDGAPLFEFGAESGITRPVDEIGAHGVVIKDGTVGDLDEVRRKFGGDLAVEALRQTFLMPADISDEDVLQFAEMMGA